MKKNTVFYGWINCLILFALYFCTNMLLCMGIFPASIGMAEAYGVEKSTVLLHVTILTVTNGFFNMVLAGPAIQKFGIKKSQLIGMSMMLIASVLNILICNLAFFLASTVLYSLGLCLCAAVVVQAAIPRWFSRKSGLLFTVFNLCCACFGFVVTPLVTAVTAKLPTNGWFIIMAIAQAFALVVTLLFTKESAESIGQVVDGKVYTEEELAALGEKEQKKAERTAKFKNSESFTFKEALKTKEIWLCAIALGLAQYIIVGVNSQGLYRVYDAFGATQGAVIMGTMSVIGLVGRFGGALTDYIHSKYIVMLGGLAYLISMLLALMPNMSMFAAYMFVGFTGIGYATLNSAVAATVANFFGKEHYGKIFGLVQGVATFVFSTVSSYLNTFIQEKTGSYNPVFTMLLVMSVIIVIAGLVMKTPKKRT